MLEMQCFMIEHPLFSETQGGIHRNMTSPAFLGWVYHPFVRQHPTLNFQLSFSNFIFPLPLLAVHSSLEPFMNTFSMSACIGFPHFLALPHHILRLARLVTISWPSQCFLPTQYSRYCGAGYCRRTEGQTGL